MTRWKTPKLPQIAYRRNSLLKSVRSSKVLRNESEIKTDELFRGLSEKKSTSNVFAVQLPKFELLSLPTNCTTFMQ